VVVLRAQKIIQRPYCTKSYKVWCEYRNMKHKSVCVFLVTIPSVNFAEVCSRPILIDTSYVKLIRSNMR